METARLQEILSWMRGTDLVELSWKRGDDGLELRLEGAPASFASPAFPATSLVPAASPAVGLFRFSSPGKPRTAQEGRTVAEGEVLGLVETGGEPVEVKSPSAGKLSKVLIDDGKAVEWGQPLFLIAP